MAQIKTVFPDAYKFRQEKDVPTFSSSIKKGSYQLTVEPIINTGEDTSSTSCRCFTIYLLCPPHASSLTSSLRPEPKCSSPVGLQAPGAETRLPHEPGHHRETAPQGQQMLVFVATSRLQKVIIALDANDGPPAASLQTFLSSLLPAMSVPEEKLTRWHPRFNVDTVPAIQASSLPQPPHTEKLSTAQEVLDKARSLITPKVQHSVRRWRR